MAIELKRSIDAFLRQPVDATSTPQAADDELLELVASDVAAGLAAEVAAEEAAPPPRAMAYPPAGPVALPPLNLAA